MTANHRPLWQFEAPWIQGTARGSAQALGSSVWLWMHDMRHRSQTLQDIEHRLLAPIECGQYVIVRNPKIAPHPLALLLFARFGAKAEARYLANPTQRLGQREWHSGDRFWLIDWSAPFGHTLALRLPIASLLEGHGAQSLRRRKATVESQATGRTRVWGGSTPPAKTTLDERASSSSVERPQRELHMSAI